MLANALVSPRPHSSFSGIEIGAGLNDGWISGIDLLGLAERSVRCCEVTDRNRRTRRGEKDRHPAVLLPVALSLGRPQFPADFDDLRRIGIDPFGLAERAARRWRSRHARWRGASFNQRPELATAVRSSAMSRRAWVTSAKPGAALSAFCKAVSAPEKSPRDAERRASAIRFLA